MGPRALALASIVAVLLAVPLEATSARAQGGAATPVEGTVVLRIVGPDDPALRDSIRELLARLHVVVATAALDGDGGSAMQTVARVDIDLSSRTDALLLVTDDTGEVRFRHAVPRDTTAAIVREEIAHAVQSAVESALLAAHERASRPPAPAQAPAPSAAASALPPPAPPPSVASSVALPPPPPPEPFSTKEQPVAASRPSPFGLEIVTLAGVGPIADGASPAARIGLGVAVISQAKLHPSLGLSFLYTVPFETSSVGAADLSTQLTIASVRLLPAIELAHAKWLAVDLGAGGGFDLSTVSPHPDDPVYYVSDSSLNQAATRVDPILSAMLSARAALVPGVVFLLSAGVDVDLVSREYVFDQGTSETAMLAPWRVRPMVLAGFGFTALGDGHFSAGGGH